VAVIARPIRCPLSASTAPAAGTTRVRVSVIVRLGARRGHLGALLLDGLHQAVWTDRRLVVGHRQRPGGDDDRGALDAGDRRQRPAIGILQWSQGTSERRSCRSPSGVLLVPRALLPELSA